MAADINIAYQNYQSAGAENAEALENLIVNGEGIIRHFSELYGQEFDRDDLYQTGVIGLLRAARTYNAECGTAFSTWASTCVISEIRHYVRREHAYMDAGYQGTGKAKDDDLEEQAKDKAGFLSYEDADLRAVEKPQSFHLALEDKLTLEQAAKRLNNLQREVIDSLYFREMTQQQTADELGLTQRRVSRLKCAAITLLHELMDSDSFHLVDSKYSFKNISSLKFKKEKH